MSKQTSNSASDLTVVTFCWGEKFGPAHATALRNMVAAHLHAPHRFVVITDQEGHDCETFPLWPNDYHVAGRPSNFNRLKLFDPATQQQLGSRIVQIDLDTVILDDITRLVKCPEPFRIMEGTAGRRGRPRVNPFNGSFWVHDIGTCEHMWTRLVDEGPSALSSTRNVGSDQAWIAHCDPSAPVFTTQDGLYQYRMLNGLVADDARAVFYAGPLNPWDKATEEDQPRLARVWQAYAAGRVSPRRGQRTRCLVLGVGETVWTDAMQAGMDPRDSIVAFPEIISTFPRPVDGVALTFAHSKRVARSLGFKDEDIVLCGSEFIPPSTKYLRTGRGDFMAV